jgi:hypothetical protein
MRLLKLPRVDSPDSEQIESSKQIPDISEVSQEASESPKEKIVTKSKENGNAVDGFKTWFETNKSNLESEYPGMKLADLKKEAIKKYKVKISCKLNNLLLSP